MVRKGLVNAKPGPVARLAIAASTAADISGFLRFSSPICPAVLAL
jgi:hypothetical protein